MSDQTVVTPVATEQPTTAPVAPEQPQQAVAPVSTLNTDTLRDALIVAGHDVSAVWGQVVTFAKVAEGDLALNIKKGLGYLGHSAVKVFDEALLLSKLK